jgi:hypothetical protein
LRSAGTCASRFPRDVEELLAERGLHADHVTVWRWVQRYAPEMERRLRRHLKPTNDSWRVDETYIRVKGKWVLFYTGLWPFADCEQTANNSIHSNRTNHTYIQETIVPLVRCTELPMFEGCPLAVTAQSLQRVRVAVVRRDSQPLLRPCRLHPTYLPVRYPSLSERVLPSEGITTHRSFRSRSD